MGVFGDGVFGDGVLGVVFEVLATIVYRAFAVWGLTGGG